MATLEQGISFLEASLARHTGPILPPEVVVHLYTRLGMTPLPSLS